MLAGPCTMGGNDDDDDDDDELGSADWAADDDWAR